MAVQGKLVPQDPTDEPASLLLARIRAEKEALVKEGKLKKEKNPSVIFRGDDHRFYEKIGKDDPVCIEDEIPFDIPDNWTWCRLSAFSSVFGGKRIPAGRKLVSEDTGHIYIRISDMKDGTVNRNNLLFVPDDIYPSISKYIIKKEDVFITVAGTIGRVGKIPEELDGANLTENADRLVFSGIDQDWLIKMLQSFFVQNQIADVTTKVGQPKLAIKRIEKLLIPVPPLSEQEKIVKKIVELWPYLNEYEEASQKIETLNLGFPAQIQKSILQSAIQGQLVSQDADDEPASLLLARIRTEKEKLVKEGKLKRDKHASLICRRGRSYYEKVDGIERCIDDEIPFEVPNNWAWIRLGTICEVARGGSPRPIRQYLTESEKGINWIKIGDSDKAGKYINSTKEKITPEGAKKSRVVHQGDFLLTNSMSFGRPYILNIDGCIHDGWLVLSGYQEVYNRDFLFYMLSSTFAYYQFCNVVSGAVVKNLNRDKVASAIFPLPPLAEQQRVVDKIENALNCIKSFSKILE